MSHTRNRLFHPRLCRLEDRTAPAAGMLDPTFGVGGRVTTRFPVPSADIGQATAIDSLGRMVIAGQTNNGSNQDFAITRFTPAGALDTTFGGTGIMTFGFGGFDDYAYSVAVDSLDRVVVAGYTDTNGAGNDDFAVARLTAAGVLDVSFDGDGKQTIAFGTAGDRAFGVAVDSLDRIVAAGYTQTGSNTDFAVARLTVAGALDNSFDGDGRQTITFGAQTDGAKCVTVDSLNRVVVAGSISNGSIGSFAVARLTAAGALDATFDGDGRKTVGFGAFGGNANGVAVDSLDRIVLVGSTSNGSNADFAVARLTTAGALDSSFDGDGRQTVGFGASFHDNATSVAIDSLDRVVVAGYTYTGSNIYFAVARFTAAGALDTSFDGDGKQTIVFGAFEDTARGVAIDSQDRVVVAGDTYDVYRDFAAARLTVAGALDGSFDGDGRKTLDLKANSNGTGNAVAVDSLGRTVVAGVSSGVTVYTFAVARYTPAGALDATFGGTGIVSFAFGAVYDFLFGMTIDSLDRVVLAGYTENGSGSDFAVARLTAAGALDASFDGDGKQTIPFGTAQFSSTTVAVDSLNRVVVAGTTFNGSNSDFSVARLTVAGALDASFDGDGMQSITFGTGDDTAAGVAIDSLDRVVVAGTTENASVADFAVARLTVGGTLDSSFDGDGKQTIDFGASYEAAFGVAIDSLNRVVVAGYSFNGSDNDFAVSRLTVAGALDPSFDGDGRQTISFGTTNEGAAGVAVDSLDRVVASGGASDGLNSNWAVARLTSAGAVDSSFDADGRQTITFLGGVESATGVAVTSADRVVVGGYSEFNGHFVAVARLTGDTTTASAQVNDGSAQRSRVTSLTVRFSGIVTFSGPPADAFTLMRNGGKAVNFIATVSVEFGATVVKLSNFTGAEAQFGSLRDGRYTMNALASQISSGGQALDGDANGTPGGNLVFGDAQGLYRFFGDINGDRRVDIADYGLFSLSYLNAANYVAAFDFNGDGRIDILDYGQLGLRYLAPLP